MREHEAYEEKDLEALFDKARPDKKMYALVRLLYEMAARIQDCIDISFGAVTYAPRSEKGRLVSLEAKKTVAR